MISDGTEGPCKNFRFPTTTFKGAEDQFNVSIGENHFSDSELHLNLQNDQSSVRAKLSLSNHVAWPNTLRSPGIMGWYAWVPTMECYHGLISLDGFLEGWIEIDGERTDLSGGKCYIEKDWGKNFPASWIWMQSNHFNQEKTCITASIAKIPWKGTSFPGFIVGMLVEGELYRFATYTGAKVSRVVVNDDLVHLTFQDKKNRLNLRAKRKPGSMLWAPTKTEMILKVEESLQTEIEVQLFSHRFKKVIFEGAGLQGGLEVHGNMADLQ